VPDIEPIQATIAKVAAKLCNIPTGTGTLSPTHKESLDKNVQPAVQSLPTAWVDLTGYASHRGTSQGFDNFKLSAQRVEETRKYISTYAPNIHFGKTLALGDSKSTGGASDNDGRFRAVDVLVFSTPRPPRPVDGSIWFDPFILFLHVGESQLVTVRGGKFLMTVESTSSGVVKVFDPASAPSFVPNNQLGDGKSVVLTSSEQTIRVTGFSEGTAVLEAGTSTLLSNEPRRILGRMTVIVRPAILQIFFHYLNGPPGIKTSRKPGGEEQLLSMMNKVYMQAQIEFASAGNPTLEVSGLRGAGVFAARHRTPDMQKIVANAKTGVFFNVFFVGELLNGDSDANFGTPSDFLALTDMSSDSQKPNKCCIMRDFRSAPREAFLNSGLVLAHEAGHALDQPDSDNPITLMSGSASNGGMLIPPEVAQAMKASIKKFPVS
jgi:hypothetical protein